MEDFPVWLKAARASRGWSQRDLALRVGVGQQTVRGPRRPPRRHRTRRGRASGSPTASGPGTPPSTRCWKPATAAGRSAASST
ncbi:multiprotein-bridging factor 1 family protein [Streptomyces sp. NPDC058051]|uniref:helix-turn-helix domain-containing protein n=1 Tax=Streptomyces sp. NPDC058051 TaxID=3346315 RepID=UPI0036F02870